MSPTTAATPTATSSRPSVKRSMSMRAFRRAISMPTVEKSFQSVRSASRASLRRMSSFKQSPSESSTSLPSSPTFTTPDYTSSSPGSQPSPAISPLTRPKLNRTMVDACARPRYALDGP
ncbi:hypothetical protein C8J57DRAFT_1491498 [Mycena rebaudengoi]|nr:hypothetical protein C8J57DRAFT_1491498 [Mycena rebaudengoi]